jgi:hypothetical protein
MPDNIGTIYIPAPVVQLKNTQFLEYGVIIPQILEVPCRTVHIDTTQYWATPSKDHGVFTGWYYTPQTDEVGNPIAAPTFDSWTVTRIRDKQYPSDYSWWLLCTVDQYINACRTCCGNAFTPITYTVPTIAPCQTICESVNDEGLYYAIFALPELGDGQTYFPIGSYDNVPMPTANAAGYATEGALQTFLNTNWNLVGDFSPGVQLQWTVSGGIVTAVVEDGGELSDVICVVINAITPP